MNRLSYRWSSLFMLHLLGSLRRIGLVGAFAALAGCAGSAPYTVGPHKTADPDRRPIPQPEEYVEYFLWDTIEQTAIRPIGNLLDPYWIGRQTGRAIGIAEPMPAHNVNALGDVPASSWYTPRHFHTPMSAAELARGPNRSDGPCKDGPWTVKGGKFEGATPGFQIQDACGDRYLLKFGRPPYEELTTSAEVISTKVFYAAGYFVPENYIAYFRPDQLEIDPDATVRTATGERPMMREDIETMLRGHAMTPAGEVRALASKFVDGRPIGPWRFEGTRSDDPNDRVAHQHRRELRGLRVLSSWLNDTDRRSANTFAVYTDEGWVKHYLLDMGSTLGANGGGHKTTKHGHEYMLDPRTIAAATLSLGLYERPWMFVDAESLIVHPAVGYYEAEWFRPDTWVPSFPNPAFNKMTEEDAYWGARLVAAFSRDDVAAIVRSARISDPAAEAHLIDVMMARRAKILQHWFGRIAPLDRFAVTPSALAFDDLAVTSGAAPATGRRYRYAIEHDGYWLVPFTTTDAPRIPLTLPDGRTLAAYFAAENVTRERDRVVRVRLEILGDDMAGRPLDVYVHLPGINADPHVGTALRVAGVER